MPPIMGKGQLVACAVGALLLPACVGAFVTPGVGRWTTSGARGSTSAITRCRASPEASTLPSAPVATTAEAAKANLRDALAANGGSTLAADVVAAAEELAKFKPPSSTANFWQLNCGNWISIGEDFSGTNRTADGVECTLGRLVFNIFEPVTLPILLTEIRNYIGPRPADAEPTDESVYKICTRWVARDGSGLKGRTDNIGKVSEDPSNPERLLIRFWKGVIEPDEGQDLDAWRKVIGVKDVSQKKGALTVLKESAAKLLLKVAFGFRGPADSQESGGELFFEMKRAPKASLDLLYLDDEMRVTRGMKGALVVVVHE